MTFDSHKRGASPQRAVSAEALPVLGFFVLVTGWIFWPAAARLWDSVFVTPGALQADGYLITWVMAWDCHALWTDPLRLFDANSFYPATRTLAGSEHMLGHLPLFAPAYALTGNPALAIQVARLATVALCGASMYALLRHWGATAAAALFGGFVYAFCPARYLTVHALQLVAMPYLPLAIVYFDRVLDRGRLRDAALLAVLFSLQMLSSFYLAYIAAIIVGLYAAGSLAYRRWNSIPGRWPLALGGLASGAAVMVVSALPYTDLAAQGEIPEQAEALLANFSASPWATYATRPRFERFGQIGQAYIGWVPALLCLAALWGGWRNRVSRFALASVLLWCAAMYLLALGPYGRIGDWQIPLPYKWGAAIVPGFASMRVPLRFTFGFVVGIAALSGLGLQAALSAPLLRGRRRSTVFFTVACLVLTSLDYGHFQYRPQLRRVAVPGGLPSVYEKLGELSPGPVLELPTAIQGEDGFGGLDREARYQYLSSYHWFPILNGYTGYPPRSAAVIKRIAKSLPDERALTLLRRMAGLRYIIVHLDQLDATAPAAWRRPDGLALKGEFGNDLLFEVVGKRESDLLPAIVAGVAENGLTMMGTALRALEAGDRKATVELVRPAPPSRRVFAGLPFDAVLEVRNQSSVPWPVLTEAEEYRVAAQYVWSDERGVVEAGRLALPYDVGPGETATVVGALAAPKSPGRYRLVLAVVQGQQRFTAPSVIERVDVRAWPAK